MDGVISFPPDPNHAMRECARRVVDSVYFPELRAMMLHSQNDDRESHSVERITNLPTIAISKDEPRLGRGYEVFFGDLGRLWVKSRLEPTILKRILTASWRFGKFPEPLRVAHLLARLDLPEIAG